ncbi:MAG: CcoQ/FixQ family Cbb3-type cytochrome c oxidase assembly chaperone [Flavobacteriales bacterium]
MLKFIKHHMTSIDGIEIYPIISLGIFTLFFAVLLWRVIKADKSKIDEVSNYPLQ